MANFLRRFHKNKYLMNRLMQIYSLLLAGIILLTVAALCVYTADSNYRKVQGQMENLDNRMTSYLQDKQNTMSFLYMELASSNPTIDNLRKYLNLSTEEYFTFTQRYWEEYQKDTRISNTINGFFTAFPDLDELYVTLDGSDNYLQADSANHNGHKAQGKLPVRKGFTMTRPIVDQYSSQIVGQIVAVFSTRAVLSDQEAMMNEAGIDAFIYDSGDREIFGTNYQISSAAHQQLLKSFKKTGQLPDTLKKKNFLRTSTTSHNSTVILLASKQVFWRNMRNIFILIILIGVLLATVLLTTLHRTFKRYFHQIEAIVGITHSVAEGNLQERIDVNQVQDELYDLSEAINFMVGSLDQYIKDNYELEIKQRDAHMQALQSQINPHFLYNTLEYIRMYAISQQQKELADVVYAFSALLRNNTNQEKVTTLKKELSFCEKYVYLYQMRYPDRIAYLFQIDPALADLTIPKFCIQPLVENYFVHGIDYTRNDNAISVKAYYEEKDICILVSDNGKGMSQEQLEGLRQKLVLSEDNQDTSIGMHNVYARLRHYFGEILQMEIDGKLGEGTKILIRIKGGAELIV